MASLSDTQLPIYFNGWYYRLRHDCFSATYILLVLFMELYRAEGSRKCHFHRLFRPVARSLVGALSKSRCLTTRCEREKNQTAVRWYGGMGRADSRQAHRSLLSPRDDEEKKSQSWVDLTQRNPSWTIAAITDLFSTTESSVLNLALNLA